MPTRDLSNKRITVWVGLASMVADLSCPSVAELNSMLMLSPAIRWNGLAFGSQASTKVDDRSLEDDASAQLRGFNQYGGGVPIFYPKRTDTGSILRSGYNLLKNQGTDLAWVERVGWADVHAAPAAGDVVNSYLVTTDGFAPDTVGDGGYAYVLTMLAKGISYPGTIVRGASAAAVTIDAPASANVPVGSAALLRAHYLGNDITKKAVWSTTDGTKVSVDKGIAVGRSAGTATVVASFPGATPSTGLALTAA